MSLPGPQVQFQHFFPLLAWRGSGWTGCITHMVPPSMEPLVFSPGSLGGVTCPPCTPLQQPGSQVCLKTISLSVVTWWLFKTAALQEPALPRPLLCKEKLVLRVLGAPAHGLKGSEQALLERDVDLPETREPYPLLSPKLGDQRHVPRLDNHCTMEMLM